MNSVAPISYIRIVSKSKKTVAALFAGAGGLDLGFKRAGFNVLWANEYDKDIWQTYEANFPSTKLDRRSISQISSSDVPAIDGIIGGPPCQSWSEAGAARGIKDQRGKLFWEYMRILEARKPLFFFAENVSGILFDRHRKAFDSILNGFIKLGYNVSFGLLNANDYGVPQDRERVIIVGYRVETQKFFVPPPIDAIKPTLKDAIGDLTDSVVAALSTNYSNPNQVLENHEYMIGGFSSMFMSRNRVRPWDKPSFTIQAGGRHAPIHPQAQTMKKIEKDVWEFDSESISQYRRLSVRECARIQTFPDEHKFVYRRISDGYKMIGNAVPVEFAFRLATRINKDLKDAEVNKRSRKTGDFKSFDELSKAKKDKS
jgi:DNA (cytosine-5)-methyltransferase 1